MKRRMLSVFMVMTLLMTNGIGTVSYMNAFAEVQEKPTRVMIRYEDEESLQKTFFADDRTGPDESTEKEVPFVVPEETTDKEQGSEIEDPAESEETKSEDEETTEVIENTEIQDVILSKEEGNGERVDEPANTTSGAAIIVSPPNVEEDLITDNEVTEQEDIEQEEIDSNGLAVKMVTDQVVVVEGERSEVETLIKDPKVLSVEIDHEVYISEDYSLNLVSIGEDKIDLDKEKNADIEAGDFTGKGIKIAILDTGIDLENTDLRVAGGISYVEGSTYDDDHGHGTALASIIGAQVNGEGLMGIAPDAELYAVKILDDRGKGYYSDVIKGLEWCVENRMDVVLMSFGAKEYSGILHESIQKAYFQDTLLIGAAGNGKGRVQYPAAYSEVMSIDTVGYDDEIVSEKPDSEKIDLYAIGTDVQTYDLFGERVQSGSSFSAAHVAGAAAQLWSYDKTKTQNIVRAQLKESSRETEAGIRILDSYKVYEKELAGIEINPEDGTGVIHPDENTDAEVNTSAIVKVGVKEAVYDEAASEEEGVPTFVLGLDESVVD